MENFDHRSILVDSGTTVHCCLATFLYHYIVAMLLCSASPHTPTFKSFFKICSSTMEFMTKLMAGNCEKNNTLCYFLALREAPPVYQYCSFLYCSKRGGGQGSNPYIQTSCKFVKAFWTILRINCNIGVCSKKFYTFSVLDFSLSLSWLIAHCYTHLYFWMKNTKIM